MRAPTLWASFRFALAGVGYALRTQRNVRIQLGVGLAVAALAAWLRLPRLDCAILALTIGIVIVAEIANTALETLVDLVSPEYHELARIAKDLSAAAVFCAAGVAAVVGGLILGPPLWLRLVGG